MSNELQIVKITPSPDELVVGRQSQTEVELRCSEPQCHYVTQTEKSLALHKAKAHNIVSFFLLRELKYGFSSIIVWKEVVTNLIFKCIIWYCLFYYYCV